MHDRLIKPMPAGFDKFVRMQAGYFLCKTRAACNRANTIDEILLYPISVALPLDVRQAMLEVNRTRLAVQTRSAPIPQFKSKDIGRGADFEDHAVAARAMNRSCR